MKRKTTHTFDLALTAILIALVFVATFFLNIKLPIKANGGLVHLGTAMLFIIAILFGPKKGAIAGAIGMGLFDLVGGWLIWLPITVISRGVQGFIVGKIAWANGKQGNSMLYNSLAMIGSVPPMMAVYYVGEVFLYNNWVAPLASIPGDLVQNILGIAIAVPVCIALKKTAYFQGIARC
ncbi:MAG: ECF transporter S component [Solibacillus sp.]